MSNGTPQEVVGLRLPESLEEQVALLQGVSIGLGNQSYTTYPQVVDGFEALGRDTRESVLALCDAVATKNDSDAHTAGQVRYWSGLVIFTHLNGEVTPEQAYGIACDALYKPGKESTIVDIDPILNAVKAEEPLEALSAMSATAQKKRDADAILRAMRAKAKVMSADKLFPELDKFISVYGIDSILSRYGYKVSTPVESTPVETK